MIIVYDIRLVIFSIIISILSAHAGLLIFSRHRKSKFSYKGRIVIGALILGGGIWTMHFVGMLALHMPVPINYAVLPTLISVLIAIILTALGLYAVSSGHLNKTALPVGSLLMGSGISSMHYIGMQALVSVCKVTYEPSGIIMATSLGILASGLSLKLAFSGPRRQRSMITAAIALGLAVSSLHYSAMYYTQFEILDSLVVIERPTLNTTYLACIVAVMAFLVINLFFLFNLPDRVREESLSVEKVDVSNLDTRNRPNEPYEHQTPETQKQSISLIVSSKGISEYVKHENIFFIKADRHYTTIGFIQSDGNFVQKLCNDNISKIEKKLAPYSFFRCHRSYLVNLKYIDKITRQKDGAKAILKNETPPNIPISRSSYPAFIKELNSLHQAI